MSNKVFKIIGITNRCVSDSYNYMALTTLGQLMSPDLDLEIFDIKSIPFYDPDLENSEFAFPIKELALKISQSQGLVIFTPEYNHSLPARIKNCIDWLSRIKPNPLIDLPTMISSVTTGQLGGARVQYELRRVLDSQQSNLLIKPDIFIGNAKTKFNEKGECIDDLTRGLMATQISSFKLLIDKTEKMRSI
jgi:chromate reductase